MTLINEEFVEHLLEFESRLIVLPDGNFKPHSASRIVWQTHDKLIHFHGYSNKRMVQLALRDAKRYRLPFELSFTHIVDLLMCAKARSRLEYRP